MARKRVIDEVARDNERLKAFGTACNGFSLGIVGFALLKPSIEGTSVEPSVAWWLLLAIAFWIGQYYILGQVSEEIEDATS